MNEINLLEQGRMQVKYNEKLHSFLHAKISFDASGIEISSTL